MRRTTILAALATLTALAVPVTLPGGAAAAETCDGKAPTILVADGPDPAYTAPVTGTAGDDVIVGTAKNDTIDGAGGNDTICGLAGADVIDGGPGDDRLFGGLDQQAYSPDEGYYGDLVRPGAGDDHVDLGVDPQARDLWYWETADLDVVSFSDAPAGVAVDLTAGTATGDGTDTIASTGGLPAGAIGSPYDDRMTGTSARDQLIAGGGDDHVLGLDGSDLISLDAVGRSGSGWRAQRSGPPSPGDDVALGGPGSDFVDADLGQDRIRGGADDDRLRSSSPDAGSLLDGGRGRDRLAGKLGTSLRGGNGNDEIDAEFAGAAGQQLVAAGRGRDAVRLVMPRSVFEPGLHIVLDVPRKRLTVHGRRVLRVSGLDGIHLAARRGRLTFIGGRTAEQLMPSSRLRVRAFGRGGADRLAGGSFADHLDGGPGRDTLHGSRGRDRCVRGERLNACEVRR